MIQFCRFELRTTDVAAARAFYTSLLGTHDMGIVPLPEPARARGAPAHWLGYLGVDDVELTASAFVTHGAFRLGPTRSNPDGSRVAIVRDPGGAVVGLTAPSVKGSPLGVIWHQLNCESIARVTESYREVFGWQIGPTSRGENGFGQDLSWRIDRAPVGSFMDISARPGVHAHWLFHVRVNGLAAAMEIVRSAGGTVLGPMVLPGGDRVAVCEDPQGAAFAVRETAGEGSG